MNTILNKETTFIDLGLIDYQQAWDYQTWLFNSILDIKQHNRDNPGDEKQTDNYLIFCEHPHVFTQGRNGDDGNLLKSKDQLSDINATYYHINRGGDITYHGPGQLVVYPVIDLENFFTDIHQYMRTLEEAVIRTMREFGVNGVRIKGLTGVWLDIQSLRPRKICALGVKSSRWVTMHGLALNVCPDLGYFKYIVPCGIDDKEVTSLEKETGTTIDMIRVKSLLRMHLQELFLMKFTEELTSTAE